MFALFLVLALGAVPEELTQAIAQLDSDRLAVATAQAKADLSAANLEAVFHRLYPVPIKPQPVPIVAHKLEIIMVGGEGCAPCIKMRPILAALQLEGVAVVEVSAESLSGQGWHVTATPTFITVLDGKELVRAVGSLTQAQLRTWWANTQAWVARKYP